MTLNPSNGNVSLLKVVAIQGMNSIDFVARVLNAYESELVVVVCSPRKNDKELLQGVEIVREEVPIASHGWHSFTLARITSDTPAHISFTSGTTGAPKGIVLSHRALNDVVERLNNVMGVTAEIREYVGVPVNFSFGFGRCRAVAAAGGACFIPANGFNPLQLVDMIKAGEVNAISAVPTQWRAILKAPELIGKDGGRIRWIEIGSQYMSRSEKEQLKQLFPNAFILQHYGLTEASRTTFLDISGASGDELESVGCATGQTEIAISQDGRIKIRGPHIGLGELRGGVIHSFLDEDGWLQTNDLGEIRDGLLYYLGRADDLINCGGTKVPSEMFEKAILQDLGATGGIAVGPIADELRGQAVLVVTDRDAKASQESIEAAANAVAARYGLSGAGVLRFAKCDEIPRTATGKVKRKELAALPEVTKSHKTRSRISAAGMQISPDVGGVEVKLISIWRSVLGMSDIPIDKSFFDLGGDSLSAMGAMIQIQRLKISPAISRRIFEGKTIREIVHELEGSHSASSSAPAISTATGSRIINATRGLLVLLVIGVHWLPGIWTRLPRLFENLDYYLHPIYRLGTPGFAMVFGLGLGYFQVPLYRSNPIRFRSIVKRNAAFLLGGILLCAAVRIGAASLMPASTESKDIFVSAFYSVLMFYLFVILASPILLMPIARSSEPLATTFLMSMIAYVLAAVAKLLVSPNQLHGAAEIARLMLIAKYNIFSMSAVVLIGTVMGVAFRRATDSGMKLPLIRIGIAVIGFGILSSHHTDGLTAWMTSNGGEPWSLATYSGVIMLSCGLIQMAFTLPELPSLVKKSLEGLMIIGILALPAFVLHEIVIPAKDILVGLRVPGLLALGIPIGLFFGAMGALYMKMSRLYGGGGEIVSATAIGPSIQS